MILLSSKEAQAQRKSRRVLVPREIKTIRGLNLLLSLTKVERRIRNLSQSPETISDLVNYLKNNIVCM
jgi:hypothetical protein